MKICIVGQGFLGNTVVEKLQEKYELVVIASSKSIFPTADLKGIDVIINCAGESRRYVVEKDFVSAADLEKAVIKRLEKIQEINPEVKVIHISSICVGEDNNYGLLKCETELEIIDYFEKSCILRLGGLVGKGLLKNPIYDWLHGNLIRVSKESLYNFISTEEVANIIDFLIRNWELGEGKILNVAASEPAFLKELFAMKNIEPHFISGGLLVEVFNPDVSELQEFYPVKTTKEYLKDYLCSFLKT